jgi:hypothetical protein
MTAAMPVAAQVATAGREMGGAVLENPNRDRLRKEAKACRARHGTPVLFHAGIALRVQWGLSSCVPYSAAARNGRIVPSGANRKLSAHLLSLAVTGSG